MQLFLLAYVIAELCCSIIIIDILTHTHTNVIYMQANLHTVLSYTVFDLISVLFAYVILGQKNRPN